MITALRIAVPSVAIASLSLLLAANAVPQAPATAAAGTLQVFSIDDVHSMALFRIQHMGSGQFWGRFNDVSGNFAFQPGSADGLRFDVTIKTESVDTGVPDLDKHLRSPDFFAAKDFPTMTFKSTKATKTGERTFEVAGELSLHGVTKPITATVEYCGMADMGRGPRAGFEATFTVKRSEFGMKYGVDKGAIGDDVKVVVGLEGTAAK
jgi:polyisoprenoid-binding protein YceI